MSNAQLAEKLGKSLSWVVQHESVLEMDQPTQNSLASGEIALSTALAVSAVAPEDRPAVVEKAKKDHKKGKVTAPGVAKAAKDLGAKTKKPEKPVDPNVKAAQGELESTLGTRVRFVDGKKGAGRIEIEYGSPEELSRIYDLITASVEKAAA